MDLGPEIVGEHKTLADSLTLVSTEDRTLAQGEVRTKWKYFLRQVGKD